MTARSNAAALTPRDRLAVASRIGAATMGSYGVAALGAIALGTLLRATSATAAIVSTLVGLLLMPVVAMAVIRARTAGRGWAGIAVAALIFGGAAVIGGWRP